MTNSCENISIFSSIVEENNRLDFLPKNLGKWTVEFENTVYNWLSKLCADYNGGYWEFYNLSNNGFFMAPSTEKQVPLCVWGNGFNGFNGLLSGEAAGIVSTLFSLSSLAFDYHQISDIFTIKYHLLLDYANQHPESLAIFAAID